jgi:hypothetical protein
MQKQNGLLARDAKQAIDNTRAEFRHGRPASHEGEVHSDNNRDTLSSA